VDAAVAARAVAMEAATAVGARAAATAVGARAAATAVGARAAALADAARRSLPHRHPPCHPVIASFSKRDRQLQHAWSETV
jgi:hypothetical protein